MAEVLAVALFSADDHVPEGVVGPGRIDAVFDAQFLARLEAFEEFLFAVEDFGALFE
jgi:hypothetical protein